MNSTVLIVEDDADVLRAAQIALSGNFNTVLTAGSVEEMTRHLGAEIEAVLLDMNFLTGRYDGAEGLNALAQIKSLDVNLQVVLMTAYGSVSLAVEALKQGATDFVLKPWRNDKLVAAVTSAAQRTRAARAGANLQLDEVERRTIEQALSMHRGNISAAAASLGVSRPALYRRLSKYKIRDHEV